MLETDTERVFTQRFRASHFPQFKKKNVLKRQQEDSAGTKRFLAHTQNAPRTNILVLRRASKLYLVFSMQFL